MPELPEVEALATFLRERAVGRTVIRADVAAINAVKTFDPPLSALGGAEVTGASRHGKFLDLDVSGLHLITHLSRAGWLQWRESLPPAPPRPGGKGPIAFRLHLAPEFQEGPVSGFDLTEAGTQKRLAVYLVRDPIEVPGIARLGPDALAVSRTELATLLAGERAQLKRALTDQKVLAGIGNAYSDEILHTAKLSPFKLAAKLTEDEVGRLHDAMGAVLTDAVQRSVGQKAATLKSEKRSGLRVHARTGLPCPVCGDTVREVSFADRSFQYCPTCQTEGRELADRRLSKLLK
ncbi:MAG: formamidopyrimidine-DNA glycosylase [Pseudonocardiales bacterium]|jgi:formamidopyrimidine-DNA glycosylase|nr:formamidopyrimidine-DNA glycosylase [Pseudonocardiales bacterium]